MPKSIKYAPPKSVEALRKEFGINASGAVLGRLVLSEAVLNAVAFIQQTSNNLMYAKKIFPHPRHAYLHEDWFTDNDNKGGYPRNALPFPVNIPSSLPYRMYSPQHFLDAVHASPAFDQTKVTSKLVLPISEVSLTHNTKQGITAYNLRLCVQDERNDFYNELYTVRGESTSLGLIRNSKYKPPALPTSGEAPKFFIKLADVEITVPPSSGIELNSVVHTISSAVKEVVKDEVELSPVQVIGGV